MKKTGGGCPLPILHQYIPQGACVKHRPGESEHNLGEQESGVGLDQCKRYCRNRGDTQSGCHSHPGLHSVTEKVHHHELGESVGGLHHPDVQEGEAYSLLKEKRPQDPDRRSRCMPQDQGKQYIPVLPEHFQRYQRSSHPGLWNRLKIHADDKCDK
jgi:hypothetical protein